MSDQSTNLMLPYLAAGQAQKHVTVNESLRRLDAIVQLAVVSATTAAEPGSPTDGQVYILPAGKTGASWGAMTNLALAYYRDGVWEEISPREGWLVWVKDVDEALIYTGSAWARALAPMAAAAGALYGLTLANNVTDAANDIDFAAGKCVDSTCAALITCGALTKRLDAGWAAGTNQGGLDTGSIANSTYHCFAIRKNSDGSGDFLFSTSPTAPTMPTGYTYFRRIGSIIRAASSILGFTQDGDEFLLKTPVNNFAANNPGTSAVLRALTAPTGIKVRTLVSVSMLDLSAATNIYLLVTSPDQSDTAPSGSVFDILSPGNGAAPVTAVGARVIVRTDTSAQIRTRCDASNADLYVFGTTHGWLDPRGK